MTQSAGLAISVLSQSLRTESWPRTVRHEFVRQCVQIGLRAVPPVMLAAVLTGVALVFQMLYWLELAGQIGSIGHFLVLGLVREIGPLLVALIVIGRSATVGLVELCAARNNGQVEMLASQGIDPFHYLVVPRVMAFSLFNFCLTIAFVAVALTVGYLVANSVETTEMSLFDFYNSVLRAMTVNEYILLPVKTVTVGFVIGIVCCMTGLGNLERTSEVSELLPRGFMRAVLGTFVVSGLLSIVI